MQMDDEYLRRQAARALRLARDLGDTLTANRLRQLAADYLERSKGATKRAGGQQQQQPQPDRKHEDKKDE